MEDRATPEREDMEERLENKVDNKVDLRLITGGKGQPPRNWLKELPEETVFLCREKMERNKDWLLHQFHVIFKKGNTALLMSNLNDPKIRVPVDTMLFSKAYELVDILYLGEEETDGDSDLA